MLNKHSNLVAFKPATISLLRTISFFFPVDILLLDRLDAWWGFTIYLLKMPVMIALWNIIYYGYYVYWLARYFYAFPLLGSLPVDLLH